MGYTSPNYTTYEDTATILGKEVTVQTELPEDTDDTLEFTHNITTSGLTQDINLALAIDTSWSTNSLSGSDVDGDGDEDTYLEAEQFAAKAYFQSLIDAGYDPSEIEITLIDYSDPATVVGTYSLNDQAAFNLAVDSMTSGGFTNYEDALQTIDDAWAATTTDGNADDSPASEVTSNDTNIVVFLSDGYPTTGGSFTDEVQNLETKYDAEITAIGVGDNSSLSSLNNVDNTGGAQQATDITTLVDMITTPPPLPDVDFVRVTITYPDGSEQVVTYTPGTPPLVETPLGYTIDSTTINLSQPLAIGEKLVVEVVTSFEDGTTTLTTGEITTPYVPCFVSGTHIMTPTGEVAVEDLRVGDVVTTLDAGDQKIRWQSSRELSASVLASHPNLRPIRILAGTLGQGLPHADLSVSPQHRMMVCSKIAQRIFGTSEVLIAAKRLLALPGVYVDMDCETVTYHHFLFEAHQVVFAEGAPAESLFPGQQTLRAVGTKAVRELYHLFPELAEIRAGNATKVAPARPFADGHKSHLLILRHYKNDQFVLNQTVQELGHPQ